MSRPIRIQNRRMFNLRFIFSIILLALGIYASIVLVFFTKPDSKIEQPSKIFTTTTAYQAGRPLQTTVKASAASTYFTYNIPELANQVKTSGSGGSFTSYAVLQNPNPVQSNLQVQFFDIQGVRLSNITSNCQNIAAHAECILTNPFTNGTEGAGIIVSDQPLTIVVAEATPVGGSAFVISDGAADSLVAPLALNKAFGGFVTQFTLFNAGSTAVTATVTYFNQQGGMMQGANKNLTLQPHTSQTLDQSSSDSALPEGFSGWALISGSSQSQLVAQVLEQNTATRFVSLFGTPTAPGANKSGSYPGPASDIYAPAIFNNAYGGFVTGTSVVNPGPNSVSVKISYFDTVGNAFISASFTLGAYAVQPIYQGSSSGTGLPSNGLPSGFAGACRVEATGQVLFTVNEASGQNTQNTIRSGTYLAHAASPQGGNILGLPVIANGGAGGFITGVTLFNTSNQPVSGKIQYYKLDGTPQNALQTFNIPAYASYPFYQGAAGLPSNFLGTALITQNNGPANSLLATTNAYSPQGIFYTFNIGPSQLTSTTNPIPTPTPTSSTVGAVATPTPTATTIATNTTTPPGTTVPTTAVPAPSTYFAVAPGVTDVIPHQLVRTSDDRLYIFAMQAQYNPNIVAYWTNKAGLPLIVSDFAGRASIAESEKPLSVSSVYDGAKTVHVLVITVSGSIKDYIFDITTNTFKSIKTLATDAGSVSGDYIGSSGISGIFDKSLNLHVTYWSNNQHLIYRTYTYNVNTDTLTQIGNQVQVDSQGNANHPSLAISPVDDSLTIAWVSQATQPAKILVRTRATDGTWGTEVAVSTSPVWTSTSAGLNIDQGPSIVINSAGTKYLSYIENYDNTGSYGHIHFISNSGSGWNDQTVQAYTHDPVIGIDTGGDVYIIGHGHPQNSTCKSSDDICIKKRNSDGSWGDFQLFATHSGTTSFDSSPSTKWSVIGYNRPETIEFLFFSANNGDYSNTTIYYARLAN